MVKPACFARVRNGKPIFQELPRNNKPAFQGLVSDWIPNKWNKKNLTYSVLKGTNDIRGDSVEKFMVNLAFTSWEIELDLKIEPVRSEQNPDITIEWVTKKQDPYFTSESILAYAYYPETSKQGTLRMNDDVIWTPDGKGLTAEQYTKLTGRVTGGAGTFKTWNGNQTLRHEIGHILGAVHREDCKDCIMFPYYNKTLFPQPGDLEQLIPKYGKRVFENIKMASNLRVSVNRDTVNWTDRWELNI